MSNQPNDAPVTVRDHMAAAVLNALIIVSAQDIAGLEKRCKADKLEPGEWLTQKAYEYADVAMKVRQKTYA